MMIHDPIYHNLLEALPKPGCAICILAKDKAHRYLETVLFENVNDGGTRALLRTAHGFCHRHAWEAADMHDAFGLAIIYHDIVSTISREIKRSTASSYVPGSSLLRRKSVQPGHSALRRLTAHRVCPACAVESDVTETSIQILLQYLEEEQMAKAFAASHGLCLPHLRRALALAQEPGIVEILLRKQEQVLDGLTEELANFIRKHDYRFAHEKFGTEQDAWRRAIAIIAGAADEQASYISSSRSAQTIQLRGSTEG